MMVTVKVMPLLQPVLVTILAMFTVFAIIKVLIAGRGILEVLRQDNKTLQISLAVEEQKFIKK